MENQAKTAPQKRSLLAFLFKAFIRFYQLVLSPLIGPRCRFQPTCSHYAIEALDRHGALKGGWLTLKRIARCHPWGGFGYDPVPQSVHDSVQQGECEKPHGDHRTEKTSLKTGTDQQESGCDTDG